MRLYFTQSLRFRLLSIMVISLLLGLVIVGTLTYFQFRDFLYARVENELQNYTHLAENYLNIDEFRQKDAEYLKTYADTVAQILGCRLTFIDPEGVVLADSDLPLDQITRLDNHLSRPEIHSALSSEYGFNLRHSNTLNVDLLYSGKRIELNGNMVGFIRLALYSEHPNRLLQKAQIYATIGGLMILAISAALLAVFSRRIHNDIERLTEKAQGIAAGDFSEMEISHFHKSGEELGILGKNLNSMAAKLSRNLKNLSRERQDLSTVLSSINDGIIAISSSKKIKFFNSRALQLLDIDLSDITNHFYYQIIRSQHMNTLIRAFLKQPFLINDEIVTASHKTLEVVLTSFDAEDDSGTGVVMVIRDISQFKKLEKIRRDFVANVSHEFKTPIAAIRGYAETLIDWGLEDPKVNRKYVSKIIKQSHQLENLVQDLLELARVERLSNIQLVPFDPLPIIADVINSIAEKVDQKDHKLTQEIGFSNLQIIGEPEMFRSIFVNLLDNAIKYTPEGGTIQLEAQRNDVSCTFSVRDNGIGIPENEQDRIFERFYRVDKARSQAIEGTGLGLSIVRHMAELQHAEIWLSSRVSGGSCFAVKFHLVSHEPAPLPASDNVNDHA